MTLFLRALVVCGLLQAALFSQALFIRADANDNGLVDISDAICSLDYLFGEPTGSCAAPNCLGALDVNDDGSITVADPIVVLAYLFAAGPRIPDPFPDCGIDPTSEGELPCEVSSPCGGGHDFFVIEVPPDMALYSLWSEGYDTVAAVHSRLSVIQLREGLYDITREDTTEGVNLIETLLFGPELAPAAPAADGVVTFLGGDVPAYEYRQGFETPLGTWTFRLEFVLDQFKDVVPVIHMDCTYFDGVSVPGQEVRSFRAELSVGEETQNLYYACFLPEIWWPARGHDPMEFRLEDQTVLRLYLQDAWFFRGVAGETANRRLARATVAFGGETLILERFDRLVCAGLHHNWNQKFRVLFESPLTRGDGLVAGIDIVECPEGGSCTQGLSPGESLAYYLDTGLRRGAPVAIEAVFSSK